MAFKEFSPPFFGIVAWREKSGLPVFFTFILERSGFLAQTYHTRATWLLSGFSKIRLISNLVTSSRLRPSSHKESAFRSLNFYFQPLSPFNHVFDMYARPWSGSDKLYSCALWALISHMLYYSLINGRWWYARSDQREVWELMTFACVCVWSLLIDKAKC